MAHINGFKESNYRTPSTVGTVYSLLELDPSLVAPTLIPISGSQYTGNIEVKHSSGSKFYNINPDGTIIGDSTFIIQEGENKIIYSTEILDYYINGVFSRGKEMSTFTIYGVENKYPLKPWTVGDVLLRIVDLVEPTVRGGEKRFTVSMPKEKEHLFKQIAPEFTFTRMTLREALQAVGNFIHAEPRLGGNYDINWDFYGEQERAKIHNYRTGEDKYINETKYRALQSAFGVDQSCTKLDSYQENLINRIDWERGTTTQPYQDGEQQLRTETAATRAEENENFFFPTVYPIDRVVKFEYIEDKAENKVYDITPYVFEKKVYDNLSSFDTTYPSSKSYAIYYSQGGKGINGFYFKVASEHGGTVGEKYSIENILETVTGKKYKTEDLRNFKFRLTYVPIYSTRVQQSKAYLNEYLPLPRVLNYTQTDNSVETRFFGENIKGAVSRMGNPEKTYTINLRNLNNIPKAGQLWDNDYYIVSVSVAVNQDLFEVSVGLSKNFNRKSQYIGASSIKRIYEVSEEMVQQRHTVYTDYIVLSKSNPPTENIDDVGLLLDSQGVKAVASTFTTGWYYLFSEISCVLARGMTKQERPQETVVLPVIASAFGNAMEFTWEYKDNFSAGIQLEEKDSGVITGKFGKEVEYTDYYGRIYWYDFSLMSSKQLSEFGEITSDICLPALIEDKRFMSPYTSERYVGTRENLPLTERKDGREALKKTYSLEFVTDEPTFVIGSAFARTCPMVYQDKGDHYYPVLFILNKRINKFATEITNEDIVANLGVATQPQLSDSPLPMFSIAGKTATADGLAWAYAITPHTDSEPVYVEDEDGNVVSLYIEHAGEILIGENIDIKAGKTVIGAFNGIAVHDVFKYMKAKIK